MGLTLAEEDMVKTHPPAKRANHIGWLIEPETMTFRVLPEKGIRAIDLIHACLPYGSTVTVVDLQVLTGLLQFFARGIRHGRIYLADLYGLIAETDDKTTRRPHEHPSG